MLEESRVIVVVLYEDRTAINHNGLPSSESFLHQEQIGLRDLGSFADSANWETVAHALIETFGDVVRRLKGASALHFGHNFCRELMWIDE